MAIKNSVANWFNLVKTAWYNHAERYKAGAKALETKSKIILLTSVYTNPSTDLDKYLGQEYCEIKYCQEDWLGSLQETDPYTVVHNCPYFMNCKCDRDCPVKTANNAYYDAEAKYIAAKQKHIDSVKRVFGIKAK